MEAGRINTLQIGLLPPNPSPVLLYPAFSRGSARCTILLLFSLFPVEGRSTLMYCEKALSSLCCRLSEGAWQHCSLAFEKLLWNAVKVSFSRSFHLCLKRLSLSFVAYECCTHSAQWKLHSLETTRTFQLHPKAWKAFAKMFPSLSKRTSLKGSLIGCVPAQEFNFSFQTLLAVFLKTATSSVALISNEDLQCTWK